MSASRTITRRRPRNRTVALAVAVLLGAAGSLLASTNASANLTGSTFEGNDGNVVVNTTGNTDWANVTGRHTGIDDSAGGTDNAFGQGSKEDVAAVSVVNGSIPPNKNDLSRFYEASQQASGGDIYLQLAWERLVNIGNANLDFEINQNPTSGFNGATTGPVALNRTAGDLLVTYDFGGSGSPALGLNRWLTSGAGNTVVQCFSANALPCWGRHVTLSGTNSEGQVNNATIAEPIVSTTATLAPGLFGEASINLSAAGVFTPGVCQAFGSAFLKSRSSSAFTAEVKDFVAPIPINVSNCGSITIAKVTENGNSSFGYTATGALTPLTFNLSNGGSRTYLNVPPGNYSVSEDAFTAAQTTAGWSLKSLVCTGASTSTNTAIDTTSGSTAVIALGYGGNVFCTYTNHVNNSPTIATTLSASSINVGGSVNDTASLTGATATAGGTVTYHAYAGANTCPINAAGDLMNSATNTVDVTNHIVQDGPSVTLNTAGSYSFQAVYSGDANNNGATSVCSTEQLLVKANPSIATALSDATISVGGSVNDTASLTGATATAGGTVTYHAYAGANTCPIDAAGDLMNSATNTVNVTNHIVPAGPSVTLLTAGTYSFQAVYSGDANNNGATSVCSTEQLTVTPKSPSASTAQSLIPNDSFTLSDAYNATGSITFNLYGPGDATCSGTPDLTQTVGVSGNGTYNTTNSAFHATTEGTWRWATFYTSGDANNNGATSPCGTEHFTITNG
ncbi:MAG: hypothetical protein QOJ79_3246 [Actinomycetota bacterium]|jgi:hypothetical protein|nr:hypothetical protein [Actinomycetota bacterium]